MNRAVEIQDLGYKDYKETWDYQEELFRDTIDIKIRNRREDAGLQTPNYFLLVEHPHVYTLGKSGDFDNLLIDEAQLKKIDASFYKINRGGDITYHGPGQIVGYPILDLANSIYGGHTADHLKSYKHKSPPKVRSIFPRIAARFQTTF